MNKVYNEFFDETYYTDKLPNGLDVIIFHKPDFVTTAAAFGTNYGGLDINQRFNGKDYHFSPGIAHFLEHKLFECEEKDIFATFSKLGCNVNAFTSYTETVYYFNTTSSNITEPLNELLDFVQDLSITKESVEKEKGIIIQELSMYLQNADSRLIDETYKALYHEYPLKYDIGGDKYTVSGITKEELEECYSFNYHPSNMAIVVVSPKDPQLIYDVIKENQAKKNFVRVDTPTNIDKPEPLEVVNKEATIKMDINKAKHCYAIKLKPDFKDKRDIDYKEWCLNLYLKAYFSPINPNYQKWLDEGLINDFFGYEVDFSDDYANILFYLESDSTDLKKLIDEELKKDLINEEILEQIKRRHIGNLFQVFNDVGSFDTGYVRDYVNGFDFFANLDILNNITIKDLKDVYQSFDYSNYALIHILPSGK